MAKKVTPTMQTVLDHLANGYRIVVYSGPNASAHLAGPNFWLTLNAATAYGIIERGLVVKVARGPNDPLHRQEYILRTAQAEGEV